MNTFYDYVVGIDPGLSGAIAVASTRTGKLVEVDDIPSIARVHGKGRQLDMRELHRLLDRFTHVPAVAFIERVNAMPKQGVTSSFNFGAVAGAVEAFVVSAGHPYHFVRPGDWKRWAGLTGKDKDAARTLVLEQEPEWVDHFRLKKHVDRADAVLIARYGLEQLQ